MELNVLHSTKRIPLSDDVFACQFNEALVHQIVTAYFAAGRAGTKAQKTRAEVRGGGIKPWRQKGSGRARAGTIRSPLWRKGGVVFAAKPRSYRQKVNKKMYKGALRSIFSELIRQNRLFVVEDFAIDQPKTKTFINKVKELDIWAKRAEFTQEDHIQNSRAHLVIIADMITDAMYLSARNLSYVTLISAEAAACNPIVLIKAEAVIVTEAAMQTVEKVLV